MKTLLSTFTIIAALTLSAQADSSVKVSNVHLCCNACVKGVEKAIGKTQGVTAAVDKDAGTVTLTAADTATLQKGANALVAAGYFGTSSDASVKLQDTSGAKNEKVQSLKVNNVHLCCAKCVTSVNDAITKVPGVKAHTAAKGSESFEVTGDFNAKEVFTALHKAGLTGKAGK